MKGYFISIKNDLLEPKHWKAMGESVWLFMWLLDKMTSISEDGVGKVLGGKPVKSEDVTKDLGCHPQTYRNYFRTLLEGKYINSRRTPYGIVISVNRADKIFGSTKKEIVKKVSITMDRDSEHLLRDSEEPINAGDSEEPINTKKTIQPRQYKDNTILATTSLVIQEVFHIFQEINPTINYGNTTQRRAIEDLVKRFGAEKTAGYAKAAVAVYGKRYAPTITTPYMLKEKLSQLGAYYKRQKDTTSSKVGFID
jgi:hypothetical protein